MNKVKLVVVPVAFLFICCGQPGKNRSPVADANLVTRHGDTSRYTIVDDSVSIPLSSGFKNSYKFSFVYKAPDDLLYYGYNDSSHSIDVFSLKSSTAITQIKIEKEGVKGFADISGIYVNSPDSIFVFDNSFIGLINSKGNAIRRWPVNANAVKDKRFFSRQHLYVTWPQVFEFDKSENAFYMLFVSNLTPSSESDVRKSFEDRNFLLRYDLNGKKPEIIPVYYPDAYEKAYYGNMIQPDIAFVREANRMKKFIYIFPALPNVYSYDMSSQAVAAYGGASGLSSNAVSHLEWKDFGSDYTVVSHFHRNLNFYRIFYDATNKYLFRFHYGPMDANDNDYKDVYKKKKLYITVFDSVFNIIHEEQIHMEATNTLVPLRGNVVDNELYIPVQGRDVAKLRFVKMRLFKKETQISAKLK